MIADYKLARSTAINLLIGGNNTELTIEKIPQEDEIIKVVDSVFQIQPKWLQTVNREQLIKDIKQHLTIYIPGEIATFTDSGSGRHIPWLHNQLESGDLKWDFWNRYEEYLLHQSKMAPLSVNAINNQTTSILSEMENPKREGIWDNRGVVVGSVQSGKTANYTGLIAKAIDAGYKRIVILCGINNDLRSQTQQRIEEGILGQTISYVTENKKVGVGLLGYDFISPRTVTTKDDKGDLKISTARSLTVDKNEVLLLIIKKNVTVLESLLWWVHARDCENNYDESITWNWRNSRKKEFENLKSYKPIVDDTPLLVIDDECDQASIDNKNQFIHGEKIDEDHDPSKTNEMIRKLLFAYNKSSYVGYTATPFANIFIDKREKTKEESYGLFPRDFIINLPAPSHYIGPSQIFDSEEEDLNNKNNFINNMSDHEEWMPPAHRKNHIPLFEQKDEIPPSLKNAVCSFFIACSVRYLRGYDEGNTMLVHASRFVQPSEHIGNQILNYIKSLKASFIGNNNEFSRIKKIWENDFKDNLNEDNNIPGISIYYSEIEKTILNLVDLNKFDVALVNGNAESKEDYDKKLNNKSNIIAIGGQRLSRGLTLKSLIVSYFIRSSATPLTDTLTQMGRWFGYRVGYDDLCKLFIPKELENHFREFATTEANLRARISDMSDKNKTPMDYVMMMERHPGWLITSRAKLRNTTTITIDYNAYLGQTVVLHKKQENQHNILALVKLIQGLGPSVEGRKKGNNYLWKNVSSSSILEFLKSYKTHRDNTIFKSEPIAMYVEQMKKDFNELNNWSVGIISGSGNNGIIHEDLSKYPINYLIRSTNRDKPTDDKHQFGNLSSKDDEAFDLNDIEYQIANEKRIEDNKKRSNEERKSIRQYYRWVRGMGYDNIANEYYEKLSNSGGNKRGILLIYPVVTGPNDEKPLIGIAMSFPETSNRGHAQWTISNYDYEKMNELY